MSTSISLIGRYSQRDSIIHRLDPRIKIIWLAAWVVVIAFLLDAVSYILLASYVLVLIVAARLRGREIGAVLLTALPLAVFTFILHILFVGDAGEKVVDWGFLAIGSEGLSNAVLYSSRIGLFLLGAAVVNFTTRPTEFADGVSMLIRPLESLRISASDISLMMFVSLRFIPLIIDEAFTIRMSLISRGHVFGRGPIGRIRAMAPVVVPLMTNSIRRAESLALAIESRGYRRGVRRTSLYEYRLAVGDWTFLLAAAACFFIIVAAEHLL